MSTQEKLELPHAELRAFYAQQKKENITRLYEYLTTLPITISDIHRKLEQNKETH